MNNGILERQRAVGKLNNLADRLVHHPVKGKSGIGHTRWATHGAPNVENAHPHQAGSVAVVHNGIIENYKELRAELLGNGVNFESDTDTECVAQLCAQELQKLGDPLDAVKATIARVEGAYALAFLFEGYDDLMIAARSGSPLAIGYGEGDMFIGSDAIALAPMTQTITYLEEGDIARISRAGAEIFDREGRLVTRAIETINAQSADIEKGAF